MADVSLIRVLEERAERRGATGIPGSPKSRHSPARRHTALLQAHNRSKSPPRTRTTTISSPLKSARNANTANNRTSEGQMPIPQSSRLTQEKASFRINQPQRVEPPRDLNTPNRIDSFFNPDPETGEMKVTGPIRIPGAVVSKIKDYTMLAAACRRAGRNREEGLCHYNIGVLYDNHGEFKKAIECYHQFMQVCRANHDVKGEALACNSIGVNYHKLNMVDEAIRYHQAHLEVADVPGKFVAHSNLGLCHAAMNEDEKASLNHREALRYAIVMASLPGESLACGNLGLIGSRKGDVPTAKACMERHLKLSGALRDSKAQADAYEHLGQLANSSGNFEDASQYFELARDCAKKTQDAPTATAAKCHVGMALGNLQFDDYIQQVAEKLAVSS